MIEDNELLRRYVVSHSEEAFAELVRRRIGLVYSVAWRITHDAHRAQDVSQAVFADLARKAASLMNRPVLGSWLHRSAHLAALALMRAERNRAAREQEVYTMNEILGDTASEPEWENVRPVLDEAINELSERDRDAIVLRFFESRPFADIGQRLELTENSARMKVERALDKLNSSLARRGVTSSTAAIGIALGTHLGVAAPAGLATSVATTALTGAAANAGILPATAQLFIMSKIKIGVISAVVIAVIATVVTEVNLNRSLHAELGTLQAETRDLGQLRKEHAALNVGLKRLAGKNPEANELAQLRQRAAVLKGRPPGLLDSDLKSASTWRNVGQATPEAANETFHWAILNGDIETLAKFIVFTDDTPENRAAFMSHFSDTVRARYPTPEMIEVAPYLGKSTIATEPPIDAFAVTVGGDNISAERNPLRRMRLWYRLADGSELSGSTAWQLTSHGWVPTSTPSLSEPEGPARFIDPATGDPLPNKVPLNVGR